MALKSGLSRRLASERAARGLSYARFAELLGVPVTSAFDWENGVHLPPLKKLSRIAKRLGVSVADLLEAA